MQSRTPALRLASLAVLLQQNKNILTPTYRFSDTDEAIDKIFVI
jgi:hypothetical protein